MKTFCVLLEKPNGEEIDFTTKANSHQEAEEIAAREYPDWTVVDAKCED